MLLSRKSSTDFLARFKARVGITCMSLLVPSVSVAQPIIENDIDFEDAPPLVYMIVNTPQYEISGGRSRGTGEPHLFVAELTHHGDMGLSAAVTALSAALHLGNMQDATRNANFDSQRALLNFDYKIAVSSMLRDIDYEADWDLYRVQFKSFASDDGYEIDYERIAAKILRPEHIDSAIFVDVFYSFSPGLDRIRLRAETTRYDGKRKGKGSKRGKTTSWKPKRRSYEYLSRSYGVALRPWREGEREQRVSEIEATYEEKLARFPHNKKAYQSDRKTALRDLGKADHIPPIQALDEFWDDEKFESAMQHATRHMKDMLARDFRQLNSDSDPRGKWISLEHPDDRKGSSDTRVKSIGEFDGHTIYRKKSGDVLSIPAK